MPRRPNIAALLLSALIVAVGAFAVLRWQPAISGFGVMRSGEGLPVGVSRRAPATSGPGCREERRVIHGGYRFLPACYGHAPSFDGAYLVVKNAGRLKGVGLVRGGSGKSLDDLSALDDGAPFVLFWSPANHRFFANQQRDEGMERLRLFEVRGDRIAETPALADAASEVLRAARACLDTDDVMVSGVRWSDDGRRVVLLAYGRREACGGSGSWRRLWMIGDITTGRIDPASIRPHRARQPLPSDGPYATL
jgi:hypothetical protein